MEPSDRNAGSNRRPAPVRRLLLATRMLSLVILAVLLGAVGFEFPPPQPDRATQTAARQAPPPTGKAHRAVAAVDRFAGEQEDTTIGVTVLDRWTGELAQGNHAATALSSASVVKLILAVDVLQRRHTGLRVSASDLALIRRALGPSDDDAMNALWSRFDGPSAVDRVAKRYRLSETHQPQDPSQWGETEISARDVVAVFDHILSELPAPDRDLIMDSLAHAPRTASGGFDQEFGLHGTDSGTPAVKAGWMCCQDGMLVLHSAGVVGESDRYAVALLSSQPSFLAYDVARDTLTEAAEVLDEELHG